MSNLKLATVRELTKLYPSFSESALRNLLTYASINGLKECICRVKSKPNTNGKILFDVDKFEEWVKGRK